jgi:hypothetical protein
METNKNIQTRRQLMEHFKRGRGGEKRRSAVNTQPPLDNKNRHLHTVMPINIGTATDLIG